MIQNCPANTTFEDGYLLQLGNKQSWQLVPTEGVRLEVDELARIMGLKSCAPNGYPKVFFIRSESGSWQCEDTTTNPGKSMGEVFTGVGWEPHDLVALRVWSHDNMSDFVCEIRDEMGDSELNIQRLRLSLYPIYQRAQKVGGLPLHAGLVEKDGKGILLAAPAETGKSTCCRRLPPPWKALSDEETLVLSHDAKHYIAHPFPTWSDYLMSRSKRTWNVQEHVPLSGIFFLEQAEVDEVVSIGQGEASALLNQSAVQVSYRYWINLNNEAVRSRRRKLFENACELAKEIPAFRLRVSLTGRFWDKIETVLP